MIKNNSGENKTVLITGGASGIGRKISLTFAKNGWNIICHFNSSKDKAKLLKKEINNLGRQCDTIQANLTSQEEVKKLIRKIRHFNIRSLINNAGSYIVQKHFNELSFNDMIKTFKINFISPMMISRSIFSKMSANHWGRIVNISSIASKYGGSAYSMHYGCSKRALEGLTKTFAKEGSQYNVLVNTVRLGVIDTDFHKKYPKDMKKRIEMIPLKRFGTTDDAASMVYYMGSDKNNFITGEIITVAGGE